VGGAELFATSRIAQARWSDRRRPSRLGYNWLTGGVLLAGVDLNYSGQRAKFTAICPGDVCNPALIGVVEP
jgi:hypothetical protein